MERSTCVICGKKRNRKSLKKVFGVWVCYRSRSRYSRNSNYLKTENGSHREFSKCIELLFTHRKSEIYSLWDKYNEEIQNNVPNDLQYLFVLLA